MKPSCYYHLASPKAVPSILSKGLKCDAVGFIYLIADPNFPAFAHVALIQARLDEFAVIEVCACGLQSKPGRDDIAEASAQYQVRVKQAVIDPIFLTHIATVKITERSYNPMAPALWGSNARMRAEIMAAREKARITRWERIVQSVRCYMDD